MQTAAEPIYRIGFTETQSAGKSSRVGLLYGRTGVPVFLLYLESLERAVDFQCSGTEGLEVFASRLNSAHDQLALHELRLFFEEGGGLAQIVASPFKRNAQESSLQQMIGFSRGYNQSAGIHQLSGRFDQADLVAVPQARTLLNPDESVVFHEQLLKVVSDSSAAFVLMECPRLLTPPQAVQWAKSFNCADAALYYPALTYRLEKGRPATEVSVLPTIAALYQASDRRGGIAELPTPQSICSEAIPAMRLSPSQQMELLAGRVNSVVFTPGQPDLARIWGGHTLVRAPELEFSLISVRRSLRALREAVEALAESYVLEPLGAETESNVEEKLIGFFKEQRKIFDEFSREPFRVSTNRLVGSDSDGLEIHCQFKLARCLQELRFNIGIAY